MLIDYRIKITPERRAYLDAVGEALRAIEPQVEVMLETHLAKSRRWSPHEVLPWGRGQDYREQPWSKEQNMLSPEIVEALETNLLTEDNLPYYHAQIERMVEVGGVWQRWNRRWTAEEGLHAAAIRDYLYLTRAMDPERIEKNRLAMMQAGFDRRFDCPLEIFAYTSAQELATRVSHLRTGQKAEDPAALELMKLISRDENFHFVFYRGVTQLLLETTPALMLPAIMKQLYSFEMPGTGMHDFEHKRALIAKAGIYGTREHRDLVIKPLLNFWKIDQITGLPPAAAKAQERIMKLEQVLDRLVERGERGTT